MNADDSGVHIYSFAESGQATTITLTVQNFRVFTRPTA